MEVHSLGAPHWVGIRARQAIFLILTYSKELFNKSPRVTIYYLNTTNLGNFPLSLIFSYGQNPRVELVTCDSQVEVGYVINNNHVIQGEGFESCCISSLEAEINQVGNQSINHAYIMKLKKNSGHQRLNQLP